MVPLVLLEVVVMVAPLWVFTMDSDNMSFFRLYEKKKKPESLEIFGYSEL